MDGKIIIYAIALLAIMGGVTGFYYTLDVDEAQKELILTQQELGNMEQSIKDAQKLTDLRKEASALITAAHIIEAENETIRKEATKLTVARDNEARSFLSAILKVREATVGMVFPSIALTNGTILKNAKIQSLDENLTVIQHSEGVSKVPTEILSSEIQDRLRFGFIPGGAGSATHESKSEFNTNQSKPQSRVMPKIDRELHSNASDSLVRLGASYMPEQTKPKQQLTSRSTNSEDAKINGDPNLWKSVERHSIGRAYVQGQGWLKIGSKGPIPGSGRK